MQVPGRFFRRESVYRTLGASRAAGLIGVGFLLKPEGTRDFSDNTPDTHSLVWLLRGGGQYRDSRGHQGRLAPGTLFQRFTDRRHTTIKDPDGLWAEVFIVFGSDFVSTLRTIGVIEDDRPLIEAGLDRGLIEELDQCLHRLRDGGATEAARVSLRLMALAEVLLGRGRRVEDPRDDAVARACELLGERLHERLRLPELAAQVGLGYERLRKVFRARMGVSPGEYRIRRRIDRARALLDDPARAVQDVALELGYATPFIFSSQFKQVVGVAPEAYRSRRA